MDVIFYRVNAKSGEEFVVCEPKRHSWLVDQHWNISMQRFNVLLFVSIIFVTAANATINERMSLPDYAGVIETIKKYKLAKVEVKDEYGQLVQV